MSTVENLFRSLVAVGAAAERLALSTGGAHRYALVSARQAGRRAAGLARPFAASRSAS